MLQVENISTGYGKKQVLFDVSFEVKQGEIVLLIGANGINKAQKQSAIQQEIEKLRKRLSKAQQLMLDGAIEPKDYREIKANLDEKINQLVREQMQLGRMNSNLPKYLDFGRKIISDLSQYYEKANLLTKQRLVGLMFPEKLIPIYIALASS